MAAGGDISSRGRDEEVYMEIYVNIGLVDVIGKQHVENCFMTVEKGISVRLA